MKTSVKHSSIAILAGAIALLPTLVSTTAIAQTDFQSQVRGFLTEQADIDLPDYNSTGPAVHQFTQ